MHGYFNPTMIGYFYATLGGRFRPTLTERRKRGENKEIDLKEFIESRKNRIKELFPDINEVKTNAKDGYITRTK